MKYDKEKFLLEQQFLGPSDVIDGIFFVGGLLFSYTLTFLFINGRVEMPNLVVYLPFFEAKLDWLESRGTSSVMAYTAAILTAVVFVPLTILAKLAWYWRIVVRTKKMRPLREGEIRRFLYAVLFTIFGLWVLFLYTPGTPVDGYSGKKFEALLLWPLFPFMAHCGAHMLAASIFVFPILLFKLANSRTTHHT